VTSDAPADDLDLGDADGADDDDDAVDDGGGEVIVLTIAGAQVGARVDAAVSEAVRARGHSRAEVQAWIDHDLVAVRRGGARPRVAKGLKLREGDEVEVRLPAPPRPPEPLRPEVIPLTLLHQDEALLVIDKPAGLTVHPGAGQRERTLAHALLHASAGRLSSVGGPDRPGIVHRLDKDTSGVIVVARDDAAHRQLARQFHDRTVEKTYLALVERGPREDHGVVDQPIGRHPRDRKKMAVVPDGRAARTRFRVLERFGARAALVECRPETGRTHQLRVHLKHVHAPLLADATYGRSDRFTSRDAGLPGDERVLLARHGLHASRLVIRHPTTGARLAFEAPLPADLRATLEALRAGAKRG
jgi:23S rRNA pseudouridine1911/1915/1917 synthase